MKPLIGGAVAIALAAAGFAAQAAPMDSAYGNTLLVTYPGNAVVKLLVDRDGSYQTIAPDGAKASGRWTISGGQTCFTQTSPTPAAGQERACAPTVEKEIGDTWTSTGVGGAKVTVTIVPGR